MAAFSFTLLQGQFFVNKSENHVVCDRSIQPLYYVSCHLCCYSVFYEIPSDPREVTRDFRKCASEQSRDALLSFSSPTTTKKRHGARWSFIPQTFFNTIASCCFCWTNLDSFTNHITLCSALLCESYVFFYFNLVIVLY